MKKQTRIGALLLAFAMAFSLLTSSAWAVDVSSLAQTPIVASVSSTSVSKPKGTTLSSVKATSSSKIKVSWKKGSSITGYQIQYSTSSSFKKAKTIKVKSYKTTSKTISSLKQNTKYYFRVRTYKTVKKKNYYSSWSKAKSAKTSKSTKSTSSSKVYYTASGKCYHKKNCSTLKKSKNVKSTSKSAAQSKGLKACKVCKP